LLWEKKEDEGGGVDLIYPLPSALIARLNKKPEFIKAARFGWEDFHAGRLLLEGCVSDAAPVYEKEGNAALFPLMLFSDIHVMGLA